MKLTLLVLFCALSFVGTAQVQKGEERNQKQLDDLIKKYRGGKLPKIALTDSSLRQLNRNYLAFQKKPGIYYLKQDGMACIVPDTKDVAAIPNAWKGAIKKPYKSKKPAIPNPSVPDEETDTR